MDIDKPQRLFQAVSDKDMKIAKIVIDSCHAPVDIMNHKNNSQFTTLMIAAQLIPEDISMQFTKLLVSHKAKIDLQNKFGQTALMLASSKGYGSVVSFLMDHKANYDLKNSVSNFIILCVYRIFRLHCRISLY